MEILPPIPSQFPTASPVSQDTYQPSISPTQDRPDFVTPPTMPPTIDQDNGSKSNTINILGSQYPSNAVYATGGLAFLAGVGLSCFFKRKCGKKDRQVGVEEEQNYQNIGQLNDSNQKFTNSAISSQKTSTNSPKETKAKPLQVISRETPICP